MFLKFGVLAENFESRSLTKTPMRCEQKIETRGKELGSEFLRVLFPQFPLQSAPRADKGVGTLVPKLGAPS